MKHNSISGFLGEHLREISSRFSEDEKYATKVCLLTHSDIRISHDIMNMTVTEMCVY